MKGLEFLSTLFDEVKTFTGGIHPDSYEKHWTEHSQIEEVPPPKKAILPLSQHVGTPCEPLVKVGDLVKKGQKIGVEKGRISAPVHASISGKVTAIGPHPHHSGRIVTAITIESDGKDEWIEGKPERENYAELDSEELRRIILEAGITGLGGATFPTHVKLSPAPEKKITTVLLNGAECEPFLTCDHRLMVEQSRDVIGGLRIIMKILSVKEAVIGIEDNKPDAIANLSQSIKDVANGSHITIVKVRTKYPEGGEKQLIQAVFGKEVPSGGLPMDIGLVVQNVGTAAAIYRAVRWGEPLIERIVTVSGLGITHPKNVRARLGTSLKDLIEFCGGVVGETGKIIVGGPMMGIAQYTLDVPVVKGTIGLLVFPKEKVQVDEMEPCIKCAACVEACPAGLAPHMLSITVEANNFDEASKYYPFDCIECGCCDYVCPSKRPIVHLIKYAKTELSKKKKFDAAKAEAGKVAVPSCH